MRTLHYEVKCIYKKPLKVILKKQKIFGGNILLIAPWSAACSSHHSYPYFSTVLLKVSNQREPVIILIELLLIKNFND